MGEDKALLRFIQIICCNIHNICCNMREDKALLRSIQITCCNISYI